MRCNKKVSIHDLFIDSNKNSRVVLGKGSSASVYLATDKINNKEYAVKIVR